MFIGIINLFVLSTLLTSVLIVMETLLIVLVIITLLCPKLCSLSEKFLCNSTFHTIIYLSRANLITYVL
jgi:hypothetical protein